MLKKRLYLFAILCVEILGVVFVLSSCSDDSQAEDGHNYITNAFESMKATYEGTATMNDNSSRQTVDFTIDKQANVVVRNFPIELVLQKVYPNDYQNIQGETEGLGYTAAIDSVGVPSTSVLTWKAKDQDVVFNFKKDGTSHKMTLTLVTSGYYELTRSLLSLQMGVADLIVDNEDLTRFLPITFTVDAAGKK